MWPTTLFACIFQAGQEITFQQQTGLKYWRTVCFPLFQRYRLIVFYKLDVKTAWIWNWLTVTLNWDPFSHVKILLQSTTDNHGGKYDVNDYVHPSMLEDPWRQLVQQNERNKSQEADSSDGGGGGGSGSDVGEDWEGSSFEHCVFFMEGYRDS